MSFSAPAVVAVPSGWFWMGSEHGPENEQPLHRVWVDAFAIGKYPVTNREYAVFVAASGIAEPPFWREPMFSDPQQPVVGVRWDDAVTYCRWLGARTGQHFRLPTEAERERAARGGRDGTAYPWGDALPPGELLAGCDPRTGGPLRVGTNEPNGFGLYDMSEGVHEWCGDYYERDYYRRSPERNPQGPRSGERRASRGGSWRHRVKFSRCAARSSLPPSFQYADYGFRVALTLG